MRKFEKIDFMEALKLTAVAKHGFLTVAVPQHYDGRELEVIILSGDKGTSSDEIRTESVSKKASVEEDMKGFYGSARFPDFPIDKYDVYDQ